MELFDTIIGRRSIRNFWDKKVEDKKIGMILEACRWSPSAGNRQPWEVIVVDDYEIISKLADAAFDQDWIKTAPIVLAVCINKEIAESGFGDRGEFYALETIGASIQNMMLAAYSLGLGSCCVSAFDDDEIKEILNCPKIIKPAALIPIGYPKEDPEMPERDEINQFSYTNQYGKKLCGSEWKGLKRYSRDLKRKLSKL